MDKFKNKYHIGSIRLQKWDYRNNGSYFITICAQYREHFFGEIFDGKMILNEIGQLAEKFWFEIPMHFPFVKLGNFVVMPNHVHGILIVDKSVDDMDNDLVEMLQCNISTMPITINEQMSKISPKPGSISTIVRSYKSVVSKYAHKINPNFKWQSLFYDHIIRNSASFNRIQKYIENNPKNWGKEILK